ncbi:glycosyltransferase family 2 protein [Aeromicrobium wangtongii]|uniref:glycosyltransferase family 2 protein n=1 Tax=Aeromicrobium wangtongii TaxID=2969247 RepID=UPI0020172113|nr:glycosyltransferase family A protein [Aeromicrobium wangtongii]MCL3817496.1 glycosyltransferase family 2 protein [Aeromicrobium wangtongii]
MTDDLQVLREQLAYIDVDPYAVAAHALRYGTPGMLDLLALMATDGRDDFSAVLAACDRFVATGAQRLPDELAAAYLPRAVGALAQTLVGKRYWQGSYALAARMHRFAHALGTLDDQPTSFPRLLVQTNLAAGELAYLDQLMAAEPDLVDDHLRWIVDTDRLGPANTGEAFDAEAWSASFTKIFSAADAAPVHLRPGSGRPFDRLAVPAPPPQVTGQPLVSVIMSVYRPNASFEASVRSILAQTWTNLELLVVDDCSPAEYTATIEAAAGWDPRITVLRMPCNSGTYQVRNHAIARARGELVTFQDSDDWSHPERIARQVAALAGRPDAIASLSSWVRMTPELVLNRVGYQATRVNASSMMFRREPVVERLGGFDTVRKDADSEFRDRLVATYGEDALVVLPDVLAAAQLTADSLSRDDFSFGWWAPTREFYGASYAYWHERIAAGEASPRIDPDGPRPFPAPAGFIDREPRPVTYDVAYVSDWRVGIHRYDGAPRRVQALLDAGMTVAAGQAINLRHAYRTRREPVADLRRMRAERGLGWLVWSEPVHASLTMIDSPELLMFPRDAADVRVTTDRLVVAAATSPRTSEHGWTIYDPRAVERHGRELFGVDVEWLPAHEGVAADLRAAGATATILPPHGIAVATPGPPRPATVHQPPVIGAARLEKVGKNRLPGAKLLQYLPVDGSYAVRVLDDHEVVPKLFRKNPMPASWTIVSGAPVEEFMAGLDICFGYAPEAWGDGPTWPMTCALAAGAVLVVDPRHREVFGAAAVLAGPEDARAAIDALVARPAAYAAQRELGDAYVRSVLDPSVFVELVAGLRN